MAPVGSSVRRISASTPERADNGWPDSSAALTIRALWTPDRFTGFRKRTTTLRPRSAVLKKPRTFESTRRRSSGPSLAVRLTGLFGSGTGVGSVASAPDPDGREPEATGGTGGAGSSVARRRTGGSA